MRPAACAPPCNPACAPCNPMYPRPRCGSPSPTATRGVEARGCPGPRHSLHPGPNNGPNPSPSPSPSSSPALALALALTLTLTLTLPQTRRSRTRRPLPTRSKPSAQPAAGSVSFRPPSYYGGDRLALRRALRGCVQAASFWRWSVARRGVFRSVSERPLSALGLARCPALSH